MNGHGHVVPSADGSRARCGGPGICIECSREAAGAWRHERERAERAEAERDALRAENERLRDALLDIRNNVHLDCENVHHAKRDQHHAIGECPVVRRISTAIDAALAGDQS